MIQEKHNPQFWSYKAVFSNGKVKTLKKSGREYGFAWVYEAVGGWENAAPHGKSGFAATHALAEKAIVSESRFQVRANPKARYAGDKVHPAGKILWSEIVEVEREVITKAENK